MTEAALDPIAQLEAEHDHMRMLFEQWRLLASQAAPLAQRQALAEQICLELTIHARLEEELLYPLAREAMGPAALPGGGAEAHAQAREMMSRLLRVRGPDPAYDAGVVRLCEAVERHMRAEHDELFPRLRGCGANLSLLGRRLHERRRELEAVPEALREEVLVSAMA
ncbi:hemerythrin domain-containing protein [Ramlibacter sp. AW1]|uniref:Hemerythrin domain-containing protein n=1 Tax=Ramlibacter aurantiacus TaxID=2801330 RepID=A0A937D0K6_9BURK|nr:hemerythrin domain-containing protein [Ramlibacter aurantiacus]MBL0419539.1 hemerythrin domain-containing protein [Ramlibacter aurantiacus]